MNLGGQTSSNFSSKARRFTRRLSYSIGKVIREWNRDNNDASSLSKSVHGIDNSRVFSIEELVELTKFNRDEIKLIYRDFKLKCPDGILTERGLSQIYSQLFPCGSTQIYARHLFSAMEQQVNYCLSFQGFRRAHITEINFKEFLMALSSLVRGSLDDRIRWLWGFYDINKDGRITHDEIQSMINSLYDLMGPNTNPNDEMGKTRHVEIVLQRFGITENTESSLSYNEFYELFLNNQELIDRMMNIY